MKVIFIRHGETDYTPCEKREFIGHGRDLATLTTLGKIQAKVVSHNLLLKGSELILSSPYTRALQTASIISQSNNIDLEVEIDLHEWLPDKTYTYKNKQDLLIINDDFVKCNGSHPIDENKVWESTQRIIDRVIEILNKYVDKGYKKIIVVTHGGVIRRFVGKSKIDYCTPYEVNYHKNYKCYPWVD